MKKYCLLLCGLLLTGVQSPAQTMYKNIENFLPGDKMVYVTTTTNIDAGKGGQGVTWNYKDIDQQPGDTVLQEIISLKGTEYEKQYPKANIAEKRSDSSMVLLEADEKESKVWGVQRGDMDIIFDDPYIFIKHPLQYGDSISNVASRHYSAYGGYEGKGTTTMVADGEGTLILPTGIYKVLRVRFEQSFSDVSKANGGVMENKVITYAWFDKDHKGALLKKNIVVIKSPYYNNTIESTQYLIP